jgi:hypothetical protein
MYSTSFLLPCFYMYRNRLVSGINKQISSIGEKKYRISAPKRALFRFRKKGDDDDDDDDNKEGANDKRRHKLL